MPRGILDTSTLILLGRLQDTDPLPAEPLITGALGAALLGRDIVNRSRKKGLTLERRERSLKEIEIL